MSTATQTAQYVASATASGREGRAVTSDGRLDVTLAAPRELGGSGEGTNPEQLFAAGYAACFASALGLVARKRRVEDFDVAVTADVSRPRPLRTRTSRTAVPEGDPMTNPREVQLVSRPVGWPTPDDFALVESAPVDLADGQVRVRNEVMSVDPYMRGRMSDAKSYAGPYALGEAMHGGAVGVVTESRADGVTVGDHVLH